MHSRAENLEVMLELDLFEAGWNGLEVQPPESSHRQAAMTSIRRSLLKKFHNDETDTDRDSKALALFLECNERCKVFPGVQPRCLSEEYVIGEMKSWLYDFFNPCDGQFAQEPHLLNLSSIASYFGLGAGSNIGIKETDFYSKYVTSSMSHTNPALPQLFRHALSSDPLWADVEDFRRTRWGYDSVKGNRLSFVPKSRDVSRTICTEPLLNMFFQKGIAGVLTERLREVTGIDFRIQDAKNQQLARIGSMGGRFGTIDLSSASDSISLQLLRDILPPEPLNWLLRCRSPITELPNGDSVELHMVSSMGNGYTFPLQSIIFVALVLAVYKMYGVKPVHPKRKTLGNYAVFGDDIIVEHHVYDVVCRGLDLLGFKVNSTKSFNTGPFRESCGRDYWCGHNIRGVYVKTLRDDMDSYSAINRLNRWSTENGILLRRAVSYLRTGCRFIGVPYDEADDAGIKIPLSLLRKCRRDANGAIYYLACCVSPRRVRLPSVDADTTADVAVDKDRVLLPGFVYHAGGMLMCLLAGHLRDGFLGLRSIRRKAVLRRRKTPGWESATFACGESHEYACRWEAAVIANLVS